ncbi:cation:proton antiporter [Longispora albida]|uniref:cation:proton antiporter domain-containing protein n=1 Tax=Longispora albida TaxID=203523 RepID=UPI00037DED6B|nr:cation:proton antiporter [Longispora albida]
MRRYLGVYFLVVAVPIALAVLLVAWLASGDTTLTSAPGKGNGEIVYRLLIATSIVVAAAALGGALARRLGQPRVVGEIVAGLVLGPSVLGALAPGVMKALFPPLIVPHLDALAQFGVVFFMFLVGTELAPGALRSSGARGVIVGHASIALPFLAGVGMAWWLPGDGLPFILFVGLSFSITAFPVLARILSEQNLLRTPLGATGMTAAGIGDVTAWCLLAVVIAIVRGTSVMSAVLSMVYVLVFAAVMFWVVGPLVARVVARAERNHTPRVALYAGLVCLVLASALATEQIGVHAIFGAFLAGVVMPRDSALITELTSKIEGVTLWFMLPLFFATVGLKTSVGSLAGAGQWLVCAVIVVVAVTTKLSGTWIAARATGGSAREATALGVMMNCRGLTELVVLNLGLQLGVLTPVLFVMFVIMALVTTAMTGPLLRRVVRAERPVNEPDLILDGSRAH